MVRRWVTFDGEITGEEEWALKPIDLCFYCDIPLIHTQGIICSNSFDGGHEFVTLIKVAS